MNTKLPILGILILILGTGCCSAPIVEPPIGQPICVQPEPMTAQAWNDLRLLRQIDSDNALVYQTCIEKLRDRIERHDEAL